MALYAFDGTWNADDELNVTDTNVSCFSAAYLGTKYYLAGVGTRLGFLGRIFGGFTGAGGRTRVREALAELRKNFAKGDRVIDVVGFSRGAALALHFANEVQEEIEGSPEIRFLGLWDTVPSFGVPGNAIDIAWDLNLPDNVRKCYHALALDERRRNFPVHRLDARVDHANQEGRLFEVWFRGVHSDVGGGNKNTGLSNITLSWMYENAKRAGVALDAEVVAACAGKHNLLAAVSSNFDPVKNRYRVVRWNDSVHVSVAFRPDANNPPKDLAVVDDTGAKLGVFPLANAAGG